MNYEYALETAVPEDNLIHLGHDTWQWGSHNLTTYSVIQRFKKYNNKKDKNFPLARKKLFNIRVFFISSVPRKKMFFFWLRSYLLNKYLIKYPIN